MPYRAEGTRAEHTDAYSINDALDVCMDDWFDVIAYPPGTSLHYRRTNRRGINVAKVKMESSLLDATRRQLRYGPSTYLQIYEHTGLTPHWLSLVANGRIKHPSVVRVQKLYEYLTGHPLGVDRVP